MGASCSLVGSPTREHDNSKHSDPSVHQPNPTSHAADQSSGTDNIPVSRRSPNSSKTCPTPSITVEQEPQPDTSVHLETKADTETDPQRKSATPIEVDATKPHTDDAASPSLSPSPGLPVVLGEFPVPIRLLLSGRDQEQESATDDRVVRILHIANNTDSLTERKSFLDRVYFRLQASCLECGYELQVLDGSWGVCHSQREPHLCLVQREAERRWLREDPALIVTVFCNDLYGNWDCPLTLTGEAFDKLNTINKEFAAVLETCYTPLNQDGDNRSYLLRAHVREDCKNDAPHEVTTGELDKLSKLLREESCVEFREEYLVSDFHTSIESVAMASTQRPDNIICISRKFKNMSDMNTMETAKHYVDLGPQGDLDEFAERKLQNISNRLNGRVDPNNEINLSIPWTDAGVDTGVPAHAHYIDTLCQEYEFLLSNMVGKVWDEKTAYQTKHIAQVGKGLSRRLCKELDQHWYICKVINSKTTDTHCNLQDILTYISHGQTKINTNEGTTNHALLVKGKTGSGKSTLAAQLARDIFQVTGWTNACCVVRFIRGSIECETEEQLLASLCEHLFTLTTLHPMQAYQAMRTGRLELLLFHIPPSCRLLIIVDGLDQLKGRPSLAWLGCELPAHVRMVLFSTKFPDANKHSQCSVIDMSPLSENTASSMMEQMLGHVYPAVGISATESLTSQLVNLHSPLHLQVSASCIALEYAKGAVQKDSLRNTMDEQIRYLLELIAELVGHNLMAYTCLFLANARHGLSDVEMNDLLISAGDIDLSCSCTLKCNAGLFPQYMWIFVKMVLEPYLIKRPVSGVPLYHFKHQLFLEVIFTMFNDAQSKALRVMTDYFTQKSNVAANDNNGRVTMGSLFKEQKLWFNRRINRRRLDEHPWLLMKQDKLEDVQELYYKDPDMLFTKMDACGVYQVIQDVHLMRERHNDDVYKQELLDFILDHEAVLSRDPSSSRRLVLQHQAKRTSNGAPMSVLIESAANLKLKPLQPVSLFDIDCSLPELMETEKQTLLSNVFNLTEHFVATVAPRKGEVVVWNVASQTAVRTLTGLQEPKAVHALSGTKAVILCGRELFIYDLNDGAMVCKLKGLLNIKHPYFLVQDENQIIALSRNRMCVNLIDPVTGDTIATFKAGEDRFMDSLFVSDNGTKCVCGDEAQKPFPLLVWDLKQRKLSHDIRIPGHEFVTRLAAISGDGHYIVSVCRSAPTYEGNPMFLVVYDLNSGSLFKKWKPRYNTTSVAISSQSGLVVSGQDDGTVLVWDLVGGSLKHALLGHSRGPDQIRLSEDGIRALTYDASGWDTSIFLWDIKAGDCVGFYYAPLGVTACAISPDGSQGVICQPGGLSIMTLQTEDAQTRGDQPRYFGSPEREGDSYHVTNSN